jgi:hypothetical protein
MSIFIEHLKAEIQALERSLEADPRFVKLRELRHIEKLYETDSLLSMVPDSRIATAEPVRRSATRESSPESKRVIDEATQFLTGRTDPVALRDMFHEIVRVRGCHVGGKDPINGLSSILSRAGKFIAHGRSGWTLATIDDEPKTETPSSSELLGASKTNGAEPLYP